jgi:hypothetical protein
METALEHTAKMEKNWAQSARWWPVFLDHEEMDNIEFSLAKVKAYVSSHNQALALGQLEELKLMLKHIPEKEALNIKTYYKLWIKASTLASVLGLHKILLTAYSKQFTFSKGIPYIFRSRSYMAMLVIWGSTDSSL